MASATSPIRPEQWRGRQQGAPSAPLRTERYDPAADPLAPGPGRGKGTLGGRDTVIRVSIERVQADDGRWVRNLTLNLPVSFGEGFSADQLDDYQGSLRELLDTFVNGGPDPLPKSGDQLNLDLNFVHAPDHPEAIKLSRVDRPTDFDQFDFQLYTEDPSLGPEENDHRRQLNASRALHELLHYAGLADRSLDAGLLFRRTRNAAVDSSGIMADPDTLPEPGLPAHYLRSIEDVTDSGPAITDHPLTAPAVVTASKDPAGLLAPTHLRPAHPPSQANITLNTASATAEEVEELWDSAVENQDGGADGILTLTVDGAGVTAGDLMPLILERIGATGRAGEITVPKPKAKLNAGAKHKVLLSYKTDGRPGTLSREIRIESAQAVATASSSAGPATTSGPVFEPGITPAANQRKLEVGRRIGAALNALIKGGGRMGDVTRPAVLTGGARATVGFGSPRPLDRLEFRLATEDVQQYADVVNQALAEHSPAPTGSLANVLRPDTGNPGTLSGTIDGVEVTIGPDGGLHDAPGEAGGHTVPSVLDSAVDTAFALAVGADQRQRASALFDLLWMLGRKPRPGRRARRDAGEAARQAVRRPAPAGGKAELTAQFSQVLGALVGTKAARAALSAQWKAFGATPQDVERLRGALTDLADVFRAGSGPHRALILTAGNFSGDMFGVATALTLNPKLHLGVLTGPRHPDQLGPFVRRTLTAPVHAEYARAVAELEADTALSPTERADRLAELTARRDADVRAQEERVHVLHTDEPHTLYTQTANGYEAAPYDQMVPPVPPGLRSVRLQKTTAFATSEVANLWGGRNRERAVMRTAWGLDSPRTDRVRVPRGPWCPAARPLRRPVVAAGQPSGGRGPSAARHRHTGNAADHQESAARHEGDHRGGRRQQRRLGAGRRRPRQRVRPDGFLERRRLAAGLPGRDARGPAPGLRPPQGPRRRRPQAPGVPQRQPGVLRARRARGPLSGGDRQPAGQAYADLARSGHRLPADHPEQGADLRPGQWVVANAEVTGNESAVPWWGDADAKIRTQRKSEALAQYGIENSREWRGFTELDLRTITSYLDFSAKGAPTLLASPPAAGNMSASGEASGDASTPAPAKKMTPDVAASFYREYADYLFSDQGARDFDSVYYAFLDEQVVLDQDLARHQKLLPQMTKFHDELLAIEKEQAARPTVIPHTDQEPMRLYRKMAVSESDVFLNARDAKAGARTRCCTTAVTNTGSSSPRPCPHTSVFENANAASDSETVVEFTLPWDGYWNFVGNHGTPNQQDGAYRVRDSALVHQEQLRSGAAANFRTQDDVNAVMADLTHHNVGIGHGNRKQFAALITGMREVTADEVAQAAQDARETGGWNAYSSPANWSSRNWTWHGSGPGCTANRSSTIWRRWTMSHLPHPTTGRTWWIWMSLPDSVTAVEAVRPPNADALVTGLLTLPATELTRTLELLPPQHRRWLATHESFVDGVRTSLSAPEFAQVAARLLVVVPGQALRPVSARHETYAQTARMLQDKETTAQLLASGAAVVVLPQDVPLTRLSSFARLHGRVDAASGRAFRELRGATGGLTAAVPEENLLGEKTPVGPAPHQPEGYSTATHEIAHLLHLAALTDADRDLIKRVYDAKKDQEPAGTRRWRRAGNRARRCAGRTATTGTRKAARPTTTPPRTSTSSSPSSPTRIWGPTTARTRPRAARATTATPG